MVRRRSEGLRKKKKKSPTVLRVEWLWLAGPKVQRFRFSLLLAAYAARVQTSRMICCSFLRAVVLISTYIQTCRKGAYSARPGVDFCQHSASEPAEYRQPVDLGLAGTSLSGLLMQPKTSKWKSTGYRDGEQYWPSQDTPICLVPVIRICAPRTTETTETTPPRPPLDLSLFLQTSPGSCVGLTYFPDPVQYDDDQVARRPRPAGSYLVPLPLPARVTSQCRTRIF